MINYLSFNLFFILIFLFKYTEPCIFTKCVCIGDPDKLVYELVRCDNVEFERNETDMVRIINEIVILSLTTPRLSIYQKRYFKI